MAYSQPRDLDGFIPHLTKADTKFRLQVGGDLLTFLGEPSNSIECEDIGKFVDGLIPWMQSSNYKVSTFHIFYIKGCCLKMKKLKFIHFYVGFMYVFFRNSKFLNHNINIVCVLQIYVFFLLLLVLFGWLGCCLVTGINVLPSRAFLSKSFKCLLRL